MNRGFRNPRWGYGRRVGPPTVGNETHGNTPQPLAGYRLEVVRASDSSHPSDGQESSRRWAPVVRVPGTSRPNDSHEPSNRRARDTFATIISRKARIERPGGPSAQAGANAGGALPLSICESGVICGCVFPVSPASPSPLLNLRAPPEIPCDSDLFCPLFSLMEWKEAHRLPVPGCSSRCRS